MIGKKLERKIHINSSTYRETCSRSRQIDLLKYEANRNKKVHGRALLKQAGPTTLNMKGFKSHRGGWCVN